MLAVACAAIVAIGRLQDDATRSRDSQFELVSLRLNLAQIQQVPWGAAPDEGDSPSDVHDELQGDEQQIAQGIAKLERDDALPDRAAVEVPFKRTMSALWRIFDLVSKGRSDESNKASDTAARQAAKADIALERAATVNRARSLHALRQARIESAAVILLLFAAYALFYRRATKARRRAEELARENHRLLAASQEEALTDQLTGIGNRRALMADLESLGARARVSRRCSRSSTWTASSSTTTPSATPPATPCSSCWAAGSPRDGRHGQRVPDGRRRVLHPRDRARG
jgi:hypothetical protein